MTIDEFNALPLALPVHNHAPALASSGRQQTHQGRIITTLKVDGALPGAPHIVHMTVLEDAYFNPSINRTI